MPLEDILQEVEKRKEEEIKRISDEYKSRIDSVNAGVEKELRDLESKYAKKTEDDSRSMRDREIELAHMEAKSLAREKVSQLMQSALGRADFFLMNVAETKEYRSVLEKMVSLSNSTLGKDCIIHCRKEDQSLLKEICKNKLSNHNTKRPGIVAESSDGSKELDLTMGTILEDLRERISLELIKHLGEE